MKISCLKEDLVHGLSVVNHAVATRTPLPITQNVLLCAKESKLKLSATNLEIFITTWAGAVIEEEGEITVPARLLTELVNSLPNERIDLELPEGSGLLHLACAQATAHMNSVDAKEFPPIPDIDEGMTVLVDPQALRTAISRTAFAAAAEDSRPVLTGVEMKLSGSKFTMAAADGFRLAVHHGELATEGGIRGHRHHSSPHPDLPAPTAGETRRSRWRSPSLPPRDTRCSACRTPRWSRNS